MSENLHDDPENLCRERLKAVIDNMKKDLELLKSHEDLEREATTPEKKQNENRRIKELRESIQKSENERKTLQNDLETLQQKQQTKLEQEKYEAQIASLHHQLEQQLHTYLKILHHELQQQQKTILETLHHELEQQLQTYLETLRQELQQQTETSFLRQPSVSTGISFIHSYTLPKIWANRERDLNELAGEIRDNRHRVIALISIGGGGKSALVRKLLGELSQRGVDLQRGLWFSFSNEPDVNLFLVRAFRDLLPDLELHKYPELFDKAYELKKWLAQNRCLLVLDGLETMLEADWTSSIFGNFKNHELSNFLKGICSEQELSQLIITSRYPLAELTNQEGYRVIDLHDLSSEAAVSYMHQRGVQGSPSYIADVCASYGYHILSLSGLADYLSQPPYFGDISGMKNLELLPTGHEPGNKLQSILNDYWEKLTQTPAGHFLITRLAAFRAITGDILKLMEEGHPEFHLALQHLLESMLLKVVPGSAPATYIIHPLIKTNFYNRLGQEERHKIHTELKNRLRKFPLPEKPQTLDDLNTRIEAYHHCIRAGLYDEAYEIYREQRLNRRIFWRGNYVYAFGQLLRPLLDAYKAWLTTPDQEGAWSTTPDKAGYILQEAGIIVSKFGDLSSAMDYHRQSIEASKGNLALQLKGQLYQSELWMEMGYFDMAEKALEEAKKVESEMKKLGLPVKEYLISGCQGYLYAATGNEKAEAQLSEAIMMCQNKDTGDPAYHCLYLRIRGDLYLNIKKLSEAEADYQQALAISRDPANVFKDYEGHILRGLGDFYKLGRKYDQSQAYYEEARSIAKDKAYTWLEAEVKIGLARLALTNNDLASASNQAKEVLQLLKGSEWLIQQIQARLVLAKASYQGKPEAAKEHKDTARDLLSKSGHFWSQKELEELKDR